MYILKLISENKFQEYQIIQYTNEYTSKIHNYTNKISHYINLKETNDRAGDLLGADQSGFINDIGFEVIENYENSLLKYATEKLKSISKLKIYGESKDKTSVISFNVKGIHAYDIGTLLDKFGIAVRTGQHCAQPVMDHFGISGTVRISFSFYNTKEEIDKLYDSLNRVLSMLGGPLH